MATIGKRVHLRHVGRSPDKQETEEATSVNELSEKRPSCARALKVVAILLFLGVLGVCTISLSIYGEPLFSHAHPYRTN